jgi:D-tyrosyl-tRNA(Tyr) deacylase
MKIVIQRVSSASVVIENVPYSNISKGYLILLGIEENDNEEDTSWLVAKTVGLRIFSDSNGLMNLNLKQVDGEVLLVSQFTLHSSTKKGNRPSFIKAAKPEQAIPLYELFITKLQDNGVRVETGKFGADMKVMLVNDGPVTIIINSKNRE